MISLLKKNHPMTYMLAIEAKQNLNDKNHQDLVFYTVNLLGYAMSLGHVCIYLPEYAGKKALQDLAVDFVFPPLDIWLQVLSQESIFISDESQQNKTWFSLYENRLYLNKFADYESKLGELLLARAPIRHTIDVEHDALVHSLHDEVDWQRIAVNNTLLCRTSFIVGGPGTGKTTTVINVLAAILKHEGHAQYRIGLAAPTGKAASRMAQALNEKAQAMELPDTLKACIPEQAQTLHRLLQYRVHSRQYGYNSNHQLPYDCLVIDEASMIDLSTFSQLLQAVPESCRLIFLGDPYQLASVQAGNVLAEICQETALSSFSKAQANKLGLQAAISDTALADNMVMLQKSYRFEQDKGIGLLAHALLQQDVASLQKALQESEINWFDNQKQIAEQSFFEQAFEHFNHLVKLQSAQEALAALAEFQLLCANKQGQLSVQAFNEKFSQRIPHRLVVNGIPVYKAMPVIMTKNNYGAQLYNGDMGIVWPLDDGETLAIFFETADGSLQYFLPSQLTGWVCAHAITVHKSQGSEYEVAALVLPEMQSPLLSREMFYTAVTRAKKQFSCLASLPQMQQALQQNTVRHSGLSQRLQMHDQEAE